MSEGIFYFIKAMIETDLILTDSGGIQEKAPFLGKPTLVCRQMTERMQSIQSGNSILVGTDKQKIIKAVEELSLRTDMYARMAFKNNIYGDGFSSAKILDYLQDSL